MTQPQGESTPAQGGAEGINWDPAEDPVLCSPYQVPDRHWVLDEMGRAQAVKPKPGRRLPMMTSIPRDTQELDPQMNMGLKDRAGNPLVVAIRDKVDKWREANYPGVTATTRDLLFHWSDPQAPRLRPFFAQLEAIETLIWLREVANRNTNERRDLEAVARQHNDNIVRYCAKMATGTGKTAVMGMVIAWQTLNTANSSHARSAHYTNRFAVFAPGHTVRERLAVLQPSDPNNVYDEMGLVPNRMRKRLNQAKVQVVNFQAFVQKELLDDASARALVGKEKGEDRESRKAAVQRVLGSLVGRPGRTRAIAPVCVINDEAHHCYLPPQRTKKVTGDDAKEDERASVWFKAIRALRDMQALGKVDDDHGQQHPVLDFSATPLWIDTASKSEPEQFQWVSSDFGLMDAIESGLVKVPRVPIDDDATRDETVWRKLYDNTSPKDLAAFIKDPKTIGLPNALHGAVDAVVGNWSQRLKSWEEGGQPTPPVLIFVVNKISNAVALYKWLAGEPQEDGTLKAGQFPELSNVDEHGRWYSKPRTLVVHSKVADDDSIPDDLKNLLKDTAGLSSKKDAEEAVRTMLNTVGKRKNNQDLPGAQVRCVVSVGMLTEGWDARTVTHIVGFRAFGTQLLCEQVTGRALRRTSYDAFREADDETKAKFGDKRRLLEPEYADVVGIPFEFMPGMGNPGPPGPPKPRTTVYSVPGREHLRVEWPQVSEYAYHAAQSTFELDEGKSAKKPWRTSEKNPSRVRVAGIVGTDEILRIGQNRRTKAILMKLSEEMVRRIDPYCPENGNDSSISIAPPPTLSTQEELPCFVQLFVPQQSGTESNRSRKKMRTTSRAEART